MKSHLNLSNADEHTITTVEKFYLDIHVINHKQTTIYLETNKFSDFKSYLPTIISPNAYAGYYLSAGETLTSLKIEMAHVIRT